MLSANQYLLPLWKRWRQFVKYLSAEPETLGVNLILRHNSDKDFSPSKLKIEI